MICDNQIFCKNAEDEDLCYSNCKCYLYDKSENCQDNYKDTYCEVCGGSACMC